MSKYIKLDDAIRKYAEMFADEAYWEHGVGDGKPDEEDLDIAREYYSDLPTIEVSEDCISRADLRMSLARPLENNNADEMYWKGWHDCTVAVETRIADAPSVVPSRAKSVWMPRFFQGVDKLLYECSNCHTLHVIANYCPNCGAKMKG